MLHCSILIRCCEGFKFLRKFGILSKIKIAFIDTRVDNLIIKAQHNRT